MRSWPFLALALLLPGCGAAPPDPAPDSAAAAQAPPVTYSARASSAPPEVELIDAGSGERRSLRLRPTLGDRQAFTMQASAVFSSKVGDRAGPTVEMPRTRQRVELVVEDVRDDGGIRCSLQGFGLSLGADASTSDQERTRLEQANEVTASLLSRARGELLLNPRGFVENAALELPLDADAAQRIPSEQGDRFVQQLQESFVSALAGALPALPREPIGAGARWIVRREQVQEGKVTEQEFEYELLRFDEGGAELAFRYASSAPRQAMPLPDGSRGELVGLVGEGRGELRLDLQRPLPSTGAMEATSTWQIDRMQDGEIQRVSTSEDLTVEFAAP